MVESGEHTAVGRIRSEFVLYPTYAQAMARLKRDAAEMGAQGVFSRHVTTFGAWVADMWELLGDGRRIVSRVERNLIMASVFEGSRLCGDDVCEGISPDAAARLATQCVVRAAGLPAFEAAVEDPCSQGLTDAQKALLEGIGAYYERLESLGLIERGHVLRELPPLMTVLGPMHVVFERALPLDPMVRSFADSVENVVFEIHEADGVRGIPAAPEGVDVRFAFPSGRHAQPRLIRRIIEEHLGEGEAVVASAYPEKLFSQLAPVLVEQGLSCALRMRKPFFATDFGRAFAAVAGCVSGSVSGKLDVVDFAFTPFSGMTMGEAHAFDASVRRDRCLSLDDCVATLRSSCRLFEVFEELVECPDADILLGVIDDAIDAMMHRDDAYRSEQHAAVAALRSVMEAGRFVGAGMDRCMAELGHLEVDASRVAGSLTGCSARVVISDQRNAEAGEPGSCDLLIMCDSSSADYPVDDKEDSAVLLLDALGIDRGTDALSRARCTFTALERLPRRMLAIERCLNDAAADPLYPSVTAQEFIDCYRADTSATDDIDNVYGLPAALQEGMFELGEEAVYSNASLVEGGQPSSGEVEEPSVGRVSEEARGLVLLPRYGEDGAPIDVPVLSPSQIESYLSCPYLWFAQRRLRLDTVDEGFGPLQKGDFAHHAFEAFYGRFKEETGLEKVSPDSYDRACAIMDDVLRNHAAAQYELEPMKSNRLVAVTEFERREVDELCARVRGFLSLEQDLLPGFHPAYREFAISEKDGVRYAGRGLTGSVDRIDVDGKGRAVIIDYKAAVGPEYALANVHGDIPLKVQTLIYAQAVRRLLGLDVVAALYVSYGKAHTVSGAYDATVIETADLPGIDSEACAYVPDSGGSFADLLDRVEESIAGELDRMFAGDIAPAPSSDKACAWCPVAVCPERRQ